MLYKKYIDYIFIYIFTNESMNHYFVLIKYNLALRKIK